MFSAMALAAAALTPTKPWNVDIQPGRCVLSRGFGPDDAVTVNLLPINSATPTLLLITIKGSETKAGEVDGVLTVHPGGNRHKVRVIRTARSVGDGNLLRLELPAEVAAGLSTITQLDIEAGGPTVSLALGKTPAALAALKSCQDDLFRTWRIDPDRPSGSKAARANVRGLRGFFGDPERYPDEARIARQEGLVQALLIIGESGKVEDCHVVFGAGAALNETTCRLIRNVGFTPAKGVGGQPVRSLFVFKFRWVLPVG